MQELWDRARHGSLKERLAIWAGAAVVLVVAFAPGLGWWSFMLRAGLLLFGAAWIAHWLTERLKDDWTSRIVGWFLAGLVIVVALALIGAAAFDGDGSP